MSYRFPRISVITLVAANLVPLFGVAFLGWQLFHILLLYSLENIVIGFYNVLRMIVTPFGQEGLERTGKGIRSKVGMIVFFCLHYGGFVVIHLFFVIMLFRSGHITVIVSGVFGDHTISGPFGGEPGGPRPIDTVGIPWIVLAVAALLVSHGVSYVKNFIGEREYERVAADRLFTRPYGRVIVLHITIVLGAFAVLLSGTRLAALVLFVVMKIIVDIAGHLSERKKFQGSPPAAA